MPTYSYACTACDHRFDAQQAFTDEALTQCPACGGRLRKMFGNVGVVFKGSGFYHNDSKSKDNSSMQAHVSHTNESAEASSTESTGESSTPASTPASAPETKAATSAPGRTPAKVN